jgi:hypothetical protein
MAVRIGGKEIAAVYSAAVAAGRDGPEELQRFRAAIRELSHEEPEIADLQFWPLGRINEEEFDGPFPRRDM